MNEWVEALVNALGSFVPETSGDRSWRYVLLYLGGLVALLVLGFWLILRS
jgi:hypothetical protein